jgi:hypothetical protein
MHEPYPAEIKHPPFSKSKASTLESVSTAAETNAVVIDVVAERKRVLERGAELFIRKGIVFCEPLESFQELRRGAPDEKHVG